jgi:hypothetical protein
MILTNFSHSSLKRVPRHETKRNSTMVLGILTAVAACPAIIGTTEAIRQGQRKSAKEKHRGLKTNIVAMCGTDCPEAREVDGARVVLRENKLYLATATTNEEPGHAFAGYFLPFPDQDWGRRGEGLVSTISDEPPQLNWIYIDKGTYEVKYGLRVEAEPHLVGPWDCTRIDKRMTFEEWEGFTAVRRAQQKGWWQLYFDRDDDGLREKVGDMTSVLEVELIRRERRKRREDE